MIGPSFPPQSLASRAFSDTRLLSRLWLDSSVVRTRARVPNSRKLAGAQQSPERTTSIVLNGFEIEASFVSSALPAISLTKSERLPARSCLHATLV